MLNSKQRASLRAMANRLDPIMQVGKDGITPELLTPVGDALEARELIKMNVLETAPVSAREAADELAAKNGADVVAVIGRRFVLYRESKTKKKIEL